MELVAGIIDVFADGPLRGNPLAVVEGADGLDDHQMRLLAREFNQAETTFILRSERADRKLRSFTAAGAEVFGAGHNALGAWLWLGENGGLGELSTPRTFQQEIGTDVLPIEIARIDGFVHGRMRQSPLRLSRPIDDVGPLARALRIRVTDIRSEPSTRAADTGASHLMVRVANPEVVDMVCADADPLHAVLHAAEAEGCYVYAFDESSRATAYARFFNPTVGLWEDAATGTAAGPLAAYLGASGLLKGDSLTVEQGTKMGRKSILRVRLMPESELSGAGVIVLRGTLRL